MEINFSYVQSIDSELQALDEEAIRSQNISYLMEQGIKIAAWISLTGSEMSKAKKNWNDEKAKTYRDVRASMKAVGDNYGPMLFRDYVGAKCADTEYIYDSIERTHRSCERILDFLRTCISGLKAEIQANQYTSSMHP